MKIAILQFNPAWADTVRNLQRLNALLAGCRGADVVVLPEMFATGFCVQPRGVADADGSSLDWMQRKAAEYQCALAGSLAVEQNGKYYNRFYFVSPEDASPVVYDKRHLFAMGGEDKAYEPGAQRVVATYRGVRFLLQVCYDLRFPVFSRNRGDYDVALYVASWPKSRMAVWQALLTARALENQCFVVGVNRVGKDPACQYSGGSVVIDPYGKALAACRDNEEECAFAELDLEDLARFRRSFPVLKDGDEFELK